MESENECLPPLGLNKRGPPLSVFTFASAPKPLRGRLRGADAKVKTEGARRNHFTVGNTIKGRRNAQHWERAIHPAGCVASCVPSFLK